MAIRTVWVGYDDYLFVLKELDAVFRGGVPPEHVLSRVLAHEKSARALLGDLGDHERGDLAFDHGFVPDWFQDQAVELIRLERPDEAYALIDIADNLFPAEAGISREVMRAQTGHWDEAVAALISLTRDGARRRYSRLCALEALNDIGALKEFVDTAFALARDYMNAHDFESAWCAVNTVDTALLDLIEESGQAWSGAHRSGPVMRQ